VARNRQRAKERQARRKAEQQAAGADGAPRREPREAVPQPTPAEAANGHELTPEEIRLQAGAPPEDVGRSDEVLEYEQDLDEAEDEEHYDPAEDQPEEDLVLPTGGPRGHRGEAAQHKHRPRFIQFLYAVVAELRRVQWPDRQALTTLTGVVLGFVLIAGGYLGLLDAIFSRLVKAIL
jgi:preprotein translocase SecE subunit